MKRRARRIRFGGWWTLAVMLPALVRCSASIPEIRLYIEPWRGMVDVSTIDRRMQQKASFAGRYFGLIAAIKDPDDRRQYGSLHDLGYWPGGPWGTLRESPAGYYTYVYPYWLVWRGRH